MSIDKKVHDRLVQEMKQDAFDNLFDDVNQLEGTTTTVRARGVVFAFNRDRIAEIKSTGVDVWNLFEEVIKACVKDLALGYNKPYALIDEYNDQAREWLLVKIDEMFNGVSPWSTRLNESNFNFALFSVAFGDIPSSGGKKIGLLPTNYTQLVNFAEGVPDEEKILDSSKWNVFENGVSIKMAFRLK